MDPKFLLSMFLHAVRYKLFYCVAQLSICRLILREAGRSSELICTDGKLGTTIDAFSMLCDVSK
jgi:hypothetical protein